jgi:hypothetical protein
VQQASGYEVSRGLFSVQEKPAGQGTCDHDNIKGDLETTRKQQIARESQNEESVKENCTKEGEPEQSPKLERERPTRHGQTTAHKENEKSSREASLHESKESNSGDRGDWRQEITEYLKNLGAAEAGRYDGSL